MKTVFEIIHDGLISEGFSILLIGGYALQAYGIARQTFDLDCMVVESDSNRLGSILEKAGYSVGAKTENFSRYVHSSVYFMNVDILQVNNHTFAKMISECREYNIGQTKWLIPDIHHLIAMKLHAVNNNPERKTKDSSDIIELIRHNPGMINKSELINICKDYHHSELMDELEKYL